MDLYLNPDRVGGGFSGAMALMADLPVVTLPDCDVACMTGEAFFSADYEQMLRTVERYVTEPDFYKEKQTKAQQCKTEYSDSKMEQYMRSLLNQVYAQMHEDAKRRKISDHRI